MDSWLQFLVCWFPGTHGMVGRSGTGQGPAFPSWGPGGREGREKPGRELLLPDHCPSDPPLPSRPHLLTAQSTMDSSMG